MSNQHSFSVPTCLRGELPRPRPEVAAMHGYAPGEQPGAGQKFVKLNTNEAPYPPSPAVMEAIRSVPADRLRAYPDPTAAAFRRVAAAHHGLSPQNVIAANGSDDVLTILTRTYVPPGGVVAAPWPTYSLYPTLCEIQGAKFHRVPWRDGWTLPADELLAADANAIYLANPNAPSGTLVPAEQIANLAARFDGVVLVDEAYAEYAGVCCASLIAEHPNVVVSRTLSKGYALAGLRLGYALADAGVIEQMDKVRDSYNVDALAQAAAVAALRDQAHARDIWRRVVDERERLTRELAELGFELTDSRANFLLARHAEHPDAGSLYRGLKSRGVLVRYWDNDDMRPYLRVTVGTPAENDAFLDALRDLV